MIRRAYTYIAIVAFISSLWSCSYVEEYIDYLESRTEDKPLARVGETYLLPKDVIDVVPEGTPSEDSAKLMSKYIDSWATRQLVLLEAQKSITSEELKKEVDEFKEFLLQGKYEQRVLSSELDTAISRQELEEYHSEHSSDFLLDKELILWSYLPITYCDDALRKRLRTAFMRTTPPRGATKKETDSIRTAWTWEGGIKSIMEEEAYNATLEMDQWIELDRITNTYQTAKGFLYEVRLRNPYTFTVEKDDNVYLCRSTSYLPSGSPAPLEYVEAQIRSIILNKRKIETIRNSQERLKKEALKNNNFEIFTKENENN